MWPYTHEELIWLAPSREWAATLGTRKADGLATIELGLLKQPANDSSATGPRRSNTRP
jgi:hypothetical protein